MQGQLQTFNFDLLFDKLSLFDEDAEMSVLGSILLDNNAAVEIMDQIEPQDFYKDANARIYAIIRDLYLKRHPIDAVTLKGELEKQALLDQVGGPEYIASLLEVTPVSTSAPYYAKIVREKSIMRCLVQHCTDVLKDIKQGVDNVDELVEKAQAQIFKISKERGVKTAVPLGDVLRETFKQILDFSQIRDRKSRIIGLPTGFAELDDILSGLSPGYLYIVAGRPSMGKSSFLMKLVENCAVVEKKPVLFFSVEMDGHQIALQMLCSMARVNSHNVRRGIIEAQDKKDLSIAAGELSEAKIFLDDSPDISALELRSRARRMKHQHDVQLIVVDYLQRVSVRAAESRQIEISLVSSQLKAIAKELGVPVVAAAQLNRAPEAREDKKPLLADLRESGAIEQDADVVVMLYRDEYYNPTNDNKNICDLTITKNRTGPQGQLKLAFIKEWTRFENLSYLAQT